MSQAGATNNSGGGGSGGTTDFVTDNGTATESSGIINILGGTEISTSGSGNTVTITNTFTPNEVVRIRDDFIGVNSKDVTSGNTLLSTLTWFTTTNGSSGGDWNVLTLADSAHPGVIGNESTSTEEGLFAGDYDGNIAPSIVLGGGTLVLNFVIKVANLSVASPRYTLRVGLGITPNADQVNGVYFEYTDNVNSGNWQYKSANASTRTTSSSIIPVTATWHNLQITVNAAASSVSFAVDGVSLGAAIATNIPTALLTPFVDIVRSAGTVAANTILVDLFYMQQILTTAR